MTKLHLLASFDGERGNLFGVDLRDKFCDATGDLNSIFVELRLPEQAGKY
jgi:hypothetical protein